MKKERSLLLDPMQCFSETLRNVSHFMSELGPIYVLNKLFLIKIFIDNINVENLHSNLGAYPNTGCIPALYCCTNAIKLAFGSLKAQLSTSISI